MKQAFLRRWSLLSVALSVCVMLAATQANAQRVAETDTEKVLAYNATDPYENWNRKVYRFNDTLDRWFLKPVAQTYRTVTPDFVDRGITNFFGNINEVRNFINSVLQLKGESAVVAAGRFTYNTVFGLAGFFDVATAFDLPARPEDFGQTLGYWGVGSGPYLVVPLLGPSTPRRLGAYATDLLVFPSLWDNVDSPDNYYARSVQLIDQRADLIPAESFISGDSYTFVRNAYLQRREFLINDGKVVEDPFASGDDEDFMLEDF
ncbi:VacJ family lipoprotein [Marinobacter salinisoli]|uniref:VacJ family lipoprotein n=1 Tax=Marinobacter salinisoli TaxID=2769486 RepID=A0ABX7MNA6_9GAMM|nr:VacJ family lipoprotein [Marinobacter salinisoli]QSP93721.1 VacJ family lipoprotein [Marinobacter salinisoli]